jgi:hypothetical protein
VQAALALVAWREPQGRTVGRLAQMATARREQTTQTLAVREVPVLATLAAVAVMVVMLTIALVPALAVGAKAPLQLIMPVVMAAELGTARKPHLARKDQLRQPAMDILVIAAV